MNKCLPILLAAVMSFSGCSLAPQYTQPHAPVPATWPSGPAYEAAEGTTDAAAAGEIPWREFFVDERLQQVIRAALENNRDLRLAALNVQRARALYGIQRAALYPAVDATANGSIQQIPADLTSGGGVERPERYDVNLGVFAWEIDFFGRLRSLEDQALEIYLATEQARRSTQILLVSAVADTYLTLAANRENLALAQTTLEAQQATYRLIKRRVDVGLASELDLNRTRTQVDIARRNRGRYTQLVALNQHA